MRYLLAVAAATVALTACGGLDGPPNASEIRDQVGCESTWPEPTDELFVKYKYRCVTDETVQEPGQRSRTCCVETTVYVFNDNEARDNWREIAEQFGWVVLNEGDGWIEVK